MAIRATGTIVDEWLAAIQYGRPAHVENGRRLDAIHTDGRLVISGATWRPRSDETDLAEYLPAGRRRSRPLFLVTGDEWTPPPFHSSVQWLVRSAVQSRARSIGADVIVVPFSALAAAGIDRTSIRALEVRPDRTTETLEPVPFELENLTTAHSRNAHEGFNSTGWRYSWRLGDGRLIVRDETLETHGWNYAETDEHGRPVRTTETHEPGSKVSAPSVMRAGNSVWTDSVRLAPDGAGWNIVHSRHWLGDCLFTAETVSRRRRRREWRLADVVRAARQVCELERDELRTSSGRLRDRDELAAGDPIEPASARLEAIDIDAPIVETVPFRRRRRYLSSFDANEPRGLYFLATLPSSSRARTVDMALDDLAPAAVHAAIARGRDVQRQGDIFAIETSLTDEDIRGWPRARLTLHTGHSGYSVSPRPNEPGYVAPLTRDERERMRARARFQWRRQFRALRVPGPATPSGARARFAAMREAWLAELERARSKARSAVLAPDSAMRSGRPNGFHARWNRETFERIRAGGPEGTRGATRDGYRDIRQGYRSSGRALELWRNCLDAEYRRLRPTSTGPAQVRAARDVRSILSVHGTAHSATEVARGPGGTVYVRGTMRHVPALEPGRRGERDHVNLKLGDGKTWYLAVRNTVPRNRDTAG